MNIIPPLVTTSGGFYLEKGSRKARCTLFDLIEIARSDLEECYFHLSGLPPQTLTYFLSCHKK